MVKTLRKHQTLILALMSFLSFLYALLVVFDVPVGDVALILGQTLLGFFLIFFLAGAFFTLYLGIKKWVVKMMIGGNKP
ncbi:MAG: hypothetical protein OXE99_12940 [Cellvibrionales bacterium]|nr:hypothetical protein [Cellvibrionales bacterium]